MSAVKFQQYVVMLDRFAHDTNGNPTATHTVFGYHGIGANIKNPSANLFVSKQRKQVGTTHLRNDWAGEALEKAGAPAGLTLTRIEGDRSEGVMYLIFDVPAVDITGLTQNGTYVNSRGEVVAWYGATPVEVAAS